MFKTSRSTGLSDADVLLEEVKKRTPGDLISYDELSEALSADSNREYTKNEVQSSVSRSERKLAVELSRALINVRNNGYKIALAGEHQKVAGRKSDRAQNLIKRGLTQLQNVRWDEMDAQQREAHRGHLMVTSAMASAMSNFESRLKKVEDAIARSISKSPDS
jgi:phage replication-related protein YjqB (UPF0714/DUF867 family)